MQQTVSVFSTFGAKLIDWSPDPSLIEALRATVAAGLQEQKRRGLGDIDDLCREAVDNVSVINGFTHEKIGTPKGPYAWSAEDEVNVFACSTISMHSDEHLGTYSYLLCLGAVADEGACEHVLRVLTSIPKGSFMDQWASEESFGALGMPDHATLPLRRGSVLLLDNAAPHWMSVVADGKEYGTPWSTKSPTSSTKRSAEVQEILHFYPELEGRAPQFTSLFVGYACDHLLLPEQLASIFGSLRLQEDLD